MSRLDGPKKLALAGFGLLLALLVLELGLRLGGLALELAQERRNSAALDDGELRILCIGESTTALGGDDAYPQQLERLLAAAPGLPRVRVINAGLTGAKTDAILGAVPGWLERFRPHVVIAMMGVNDRGDHVEKPTGLGARLVERLRELRVYKLYALLADHLRHRLAGDGATPPPATADVATASPGAPPAPAGREMGIVGSRVAEARRALARGDAVLARRIVDELLRLDPNHALVLATLREIDEAKGGRGWEAAFRRAERTLRMQHLMAPGDVRSAQRLVQLYVVWRKPERAREVILGSPGGAALSASDVLPVVRQHWREAIRLENEGRVAEARGEIVKALEVVREDDVQERTRLLAQLARLERRSGDEASAERLAREVTELRAAGYTERTRDNYRALHRLLAERGVRLVAMQYPVRPLAPLRDMLGDPPDVLFVSNEETFREALRERPYEELFWDSFAGDFGHATAAGNAVLAQNVARVLRDELLPTIRP